MVVDVCAGESGFQSSRGGQHKHETTIAAYLRRGSTSNLHVDASGQLSALRQLDDLQKDRAVGQR